MCTYRPIHRLIYQSTIDRLSVNSQPIDQPTVDQYIGQQSTDKCAHISWCIGRQSVDISVDYRLIVGQSLTDSRPIVDRYIGRQSTDKCVHIGWCIGRLSVYISVDYRSTVNCRPIVNLYIGQLSAYMLTEATYSTHDPTHLIILNYPVIHSNQCSTSFFRNLPTLFITKLTPYHFIRLP